jgi:hypothetical protein
MSIKVSGYPIDAALEERLSYEADVTEFEVEKGADTTDHIRPKLPVLTFDGVVSDTPTGKVALDITRQVDSGRPLPSVDAYQRFVAIHEAAKPVTVECAFGKFDNMALTSLTPTKDSKSKKAFNFSATFKQIKLIENTRITIFVSVPNAQGKVDLGDLESKIWGLFGLKPAYFVISIPTNLSATWAKSFGPPLHRRTGAKEFDCFAIQGDTKPDGFLTANNSKVSTDRYTYHPLSDAADVGGVPTPTSAGGSSTNVGTQIGDRPVHYDYADKTWKDDRNNSVVRRVPAGEDRWKGVTMIDPKGHRQTY